MKVGAYRHDYPWSEDLDLFLRMAEVGRLANLSDYLVKYRVHTGSTNWKKRDIPRANKAFSSSPKPIQRRGQPVPKDLSFREWQDQPPAEKFALWVWTTLKDKNIVGARKHAMAALRAAPFSTLSWRAAFCALRGH